MQRVILGLLLLAAALTTGDLPAEAQGQQLGFRLIELKKGGAADKWDGASPTIGFGGRLSIRLDDDPNALNAQGTITVQRINVNEIKLYMALPGFVWVVLRGHSGSKACGYWVFRPSE